jgi:DnaJ family protein C protein 2
LEDKSGNVSEDSEPEDPAMLERDPKEWKVQSNIFGILSFRIKIIMQFLDCQNIDSKLRMNKLTGDENDDSFFKCIQKGI